MQYLCLISLFHVLLKVCFDPKESHNILYYFIHKITEYQVSVDTFVILAHRTQMSVFYPEDGDLSCLRNIVLYLQIFHLLSVVFLILKQQAMNKVRDVNHLTHNIII